MYEVLDPGEWNVEESADTLFYALTREEDAQDRLLDFEMEEMQRRAEEDRPLCPCGHAPGAHDASGAGGSGYIANLTNAAMYCYNCTENTNPSTYTYKINQAVADPTPQKAKIGNGYAIITKIN